MNEWKCTCTYRQTKNLPELDRTLAVHEDESRQFQATLKQEPFHGLCCRQRQKGIIDRHDKIRDQLMTLLRQLPDVEVCREPNVGSRANPQMRADIEVLHKNSIWYVDVGIVCPGTQAKVTQLKTHQVAGAAAASFEKIKGDKYKHISASSMFVPFIVETGGRMGDKAKEFIDGMVARTKSAKGVGTRIFSSLVDTLTRCQAFMMSNFLSEIAKRQGRRDAAFSATASSAN